MGAARSARSDSSSLLHYVNHPGIEPYAAHLVAALLVYNADNLYELTPDSNRERAVRFMPKGAATSASPDVIITLASRTGTCASP